MGLNEGGGRKTYLKISDGRIAVRCQETDQGAIRCQNKEGTKVWWEKRYPSVTGKIKAAYIKTNDYGSDLCITLDDGKETFELFMKHDSKYAKGFFRCMPSIDLTKQITFSPWMKKAVENGKEIKKTMLYLSYGPGDDQQIPWYWTKENPLGLPQMKQVTVKGQQVWDDTDQMNYFNEHLNGVFAQRIKEAGQSPLMNAGSLPADAYTEEEETGDIPF